MGDQRASIIDFDDDEDLASEIADLASKPVKKPSINPETVEEAAKKSGFTNRKPGKDSKQALPRRRRKKSPFTEQLGVKVRPGMREIFQDLGDKIGTYDHTTFERALLALIKEERAGELKARFDELIR